MKRKMIVIGASILLIGTSTLFGAKTYLAKEAPCDLPCPNPEADGCEPLGIRLELKNPRVRSRWIHTLWYRVTLENRTCTSLKVDASGLADTNDFEENERSGRLLRFRIWDPSGNEVKPVTQYEQFHDAYFPIRPYVVDTEATSELRGVTHEARWIILRPGKKISTNPSILRPRCHRLPDTDQYLEDMRTLGDPKALKLANEMVAIEAALCQAEIRKNPPRKPKPPPPGFRLLQHYAFSEPGKYRIQAVYNDRLLSRRIYPRMESLALPFELILMIAEAVTRVSFIPTSEAVRYEVQAESKIQEFTVTRSGGQRPSTGHRRSSR